MHGRDFLQLADSLIFGSAEAEWRSAVSRAYYAAFHIARSLLVNCGFTVPRGEQAHSYLWLRLSNAGHAGVVSAGRDLSLLRRDRNIADYDLGQILSQPIAAGQVRAARDIISVFETAGLDPLKTQITDVIKICERDVLKTVTWHP